MAISIAAATTQHPCIIACCGDKGLLIFDMVEYNLLTLQDARNTHGEKQSTCMAVCGESDVVILATRNETCVTPWNLNQQESRQPFEVGHQQGITSLASCIVQGKMIIVTGSLDKTAIVWDYESGKVLQRLAGSHTDTITAVATHSPTASSHYPYSVVTGSTDMTAVVWDLLSGCVLNVLAGAHSEVSSLNSKTST